MHSNGKQKKKKGIEGAPPRNPNNGQVGERDAQYPGILDFVIIKDLLGPPGVHPNFH